jgi:hypothetical protein
VTLTNSEQSTFPFGTQLIGRTEKALSTILAAHLAGTGLTEAHWVTLTLIVTSRDRSPERTFGREPGTPLAADEDRPPERTIGREPGTPLATGEDRSPERTFGREREAPAAIKAAGPALREDLAALGLIETGPDGAVSATTKGRELWQEVRAANTEVTARLWGDLPEADLATAARVLNTILSRATGSA